MKTQICSRLTPVVFLILLSLFLQSCASSTLTSSWTDDSFNGPVKGPILVIGAFKDPTAHKIYEDSFVSGLMKAGVEAVPSYQYGSATTRHSREWLQKIRKESGARAILVTHLNGEKITTENFAAEGVILGGGIYGNGVGGYHSYIIEDTFLPAETKSKTVDFITATLFDGKSDKPIWSGHSKDVNLSNMLRKDDEKIENLFITDMKKHHLF